MEFEKDAWESRSHCHSEEHHWYKKINIVKFYIFFKQIRRVKRTLDIYRYGVETTTLSEIKLRSTAHTTKVISHIEIMVTKEAPPR